MLKTQNQERWTELYQRALFEDDSNQLKNRVEEAREAIQQRARELWHVSSAGHPIDLRERRELETALYFIKLLQSIVAQRSAD
jgi:hypothetical protein